MFDVKNTNLVPTDKWAKYDVDYGWAPGEDETSWIVGRNDFYHFIFPNNWGVMIEVYTEYEDAKPTAEQTVTLHVTKACVQAGKKIPYSEEEFFSLVKDTKEKPETIVPKEGDIVMYSKKIGVCTNVTNLWCAITTREEKISAGALTVLQIGDKVGWDNGNPVGEVVKRKVIIDGDNLIPMALIKGETKFRELDNLIIIKPKGDAKVSPVRTLWSD